GILTRHAGVRNLRDAYFVAHVSRVRRAHAVRAGTARQGRHGAGLGGRDRTLSTKRTVVTVALPLGIIEHDLASRLARARLEFLKTRDHHHVSRDSTGRR